MIYINFALSQSACPGNIQKGEIIMKHQWRFGKLFLIVGIVMVLMMSLLTGCGKTESAPPETAQIT